MSTKKDCKNGSDAKVSKPHDAPSPHAQSVRSLYYKSRFCIVWVNGDVSYLKAMSHTWNHKQNTCRGLPEVGNFSFSTSSLGNPFLLHEHTWKATWGGDSGEGKLKQHFLHVKFFLLWLIVKDQCLPVDISCSNGFQMWSVQFNS